MHHHQHYQQTAPASAAPPSLSSLSAALASSSAQQLQQGGISSATRYNNNLRVLRRRDPSIVSIFDQFSHVCLYHHNGEKWEKQGFEGSMFLYERDSYPPYGFFILNRMGADDFVQRLYPEDDIGAHGSYLMLKSYPDYTARRLAAISSSSSAVPSPPSSSLTSMILHDDKSDDRFHNKYAVRLLEQLSAAEKGRSITVGLWMFATDAREPMIDVMMRLHSYIKRNLPYPQEFRYGPDRLPPPPKAHRRRPSQEDDDTPERKGISVDQHQQQQPPSTHQSFGSQRSLQSHALVATTIDDSGISELDKLFAKLGQSWSTASQPFSSSPSLSSMTPSSSAGAGAAVAGVQTQPRGQALLQYIFASATPSPAEHMAPPLRAPSAPVAPSQQRRSWEDQTEIEEFSSMTTTTTTPLPTVPAPALSACVVPQVLNQDVISELLGLPTSSSSVSSPGARGCASSASASSRDRYEGDNETGLSDGASSAHSPVRKGQLERVRGLAASMGATVEAEDADGVAATATASLLGDVTPRPTQKLELGQMPVAVPVATAAATVPAAPRGVFFTPPRAAGVSARGRGPSGAKGEERQLVPFEADSALWPYPRAPVAEEQVREQRDRGRVVEVQDDSDDMEGDGEELREGEEEVLELDFDETSALSDLDRLREKILEARGAGTGRKSKKSKGKQVGAATGKSDVDGQKIKKEERGRRKEEEVWDVPLPKADAVSAAAPALLVPSLPPAPAVNGRGKLACTAATSGHGSTQRYHPYQQQQPQGPRVQPPPRSSAAPNGDGGTAVAPTPTRIDKGAAKEALASVAVPQLMNGNGGGAGKVERAEFVREILSLLHTDKQFVDRLYQDYLSRVRH